MRCSGECGVVPLPGSLVIIAMERRRTGGDESLADELLLDDIIIERVGEDSLAPSREEVSLPEGEEIILQGEDLRSVEESPAETPPRARAADRDLPDLEALSAEVDGISAVDGARRNVAEEDGSFQSVRYEEDAHLEDLEIDEDIVIDLDAEARHLERPDRPVKKEKTADVQPVKPAHRHEDLHQDLLDDEFIILEDESGTSASALTSSAKTESPREEARIDQSIFEEQTPEASPLRESTESEIEEIIRTSEIPPEETPPPAAKAEDTSGLSITLPEDVAKSLSEEFDIHSLEPVDLREAEKIANEDILILREEDLIEELDAMDLIPLDDTSSPVKTAAGEKKIQQASVPSRADAGKRTDEVLARPAVKMPAETPAPSPSISSSATEMGGDVDMKVSTSSSEAPSKDGGETAKAEELAAETPLEIEDAFGASVDAAKEHAQDIVIEEPILLEADEHELREAETPPVPRAPAIEIIDEMPGDTSSSSDAISASESHVEEAVAVPEEEVLHVRPREAMEERGIDERVRFEEALEQEERSPLVREKIPDEFAVTGDRARVMIIDDAVVEKTVAESESIFADGELEKSTIGLVDIVEGSARFIREASAEEDQEQMAAIMSGTAMAFEDLLVDFSEEYKFKDEDVDFIDYVFLAESAGPAGAFSDEEKKRKRSRLTPATEIFGLSDGELFEIETSVFTGEYREIDLSKVKGALPAGMDQAPSDFALVKNCRYLGASTSEIGSTEKQSIEEDVVADQALVFEESVEDIRRVLLNYRKTKKQHPDDVMDISDEIVIIDDKSDIERFADTFEPEKRENIKKLLQYLDGLFEKLPEEVIRKFAESEYYSLYTRIMKELER